MRILFAALALLASPVHAQTFTSPQPLLPSVVDVAQYVAPTSGQTIQIAPNVSAIIINPAGAIAALTVTLPANPVDGQRVIICSSAAITLLTVNGGTVIGGLGGLGGLAVNWERFIYSAQLGGWIRTG